MVVGYIELLLMGNMVRLLLQYCLNLSMHDTSLSHLLNELFLLYSIVSI